MSALVLALLLLQEKDAATPRWDTAPQSLSVSDTLSLDLPTGSAAGDGDEWLIAPIPIYNPTLGAGLGLALGYLFKEEGADPKLPASMVGVGGFASQSGSWGAAAGVSLHLDEDRWRILAGGGGGEVRYDFSGVGTTAGDNGIDIPLKIGALGAVLEGLGRVAPGLYAGPRLQAARMRTRVDFDDLQGPVGSLLGEQQRLADVVSGGIHVQWDTRDSAFWPTRGGVADGRADAYDEALGSDFEYQIYTLSYNHFIEVSEDLVVALRASGRFSYGDVPFFALSYFGSKSDLRGYTVGIYQDRMLLAGQAELRWKFLDRWAAVGFAGLGEVAPELKEFSGDDLLPSLGIGLRFTVAPENGINLRLDAAAGKDDYAFYFGVGEAF